ncbi:MAG: hypothetical protein AAFV19_24595 [Pseudomonadota bacterium]
MFNARFMTIFAVLALALTACTEPTPYQPATDREGYSDSAIEENRYRVSFAGNSRTKRDTVESYLLYRSAEVTLASGHDWFRVAEQDTEVTTRFRSFSTGFGRSGFGPFFYRSNFKHGFFGGVESSTARPINRYEAFANILVFKGEKPVEDPTAYDARSIIETIGPQVIRPEADAQLVSG